MRVFKNAAFARLAEKYHLSDQILWEAVTGIAQGQIDANLGGGVIKQRLARPGAGKSTGYRSIVLLRQGDKAFFVYVFPKSAQSNLPADEVAQFKKLAKHVLALTDAQLQALITDGHFIEVRQDAQEIP